MKTNKLLFFIASIVFITTFTNCSNETINDEQVIDEQVVFDTEITGRKTQTQNQSQARTRSGCADGLTMDIFVDYSNSPSYDTVSPDGQTIQNDPEADADAAAADLSTYFTICQTFNTTCDNVQMWTVNAAEFTSYYNNIYIPTTGNGSGNNNTGGGSGIGGIEIQLAMPCIPVQ